MILLLPVVHFAPWLTQMFCFAFWSWSRVSLSLSQAGQFKFDGFLAFGSGLRKLVRWIVLSLLSQIVEFVSSLIDIRFVLSQSFKRPNLFGPKPGFIPIRIKDFKPKPGTQKNES